MDYVAHIRDNSTGEVRSIALTEWLDDGVGEYMWEGGNYGCDCNRGIFFADAAGADEPDIPCGDERFSVRCVSTAGEVLYEDDDWSVPVSSTGIS